MKNATYCLLFLFQIIFSNRTEAQCINVPSPLNVSASAVCNYGFSTLTATLNDPSHLLVWADSGNYIIGTGNNFQAEVTKSGVSFKSYEVWTEAGTIAHIGPLPQQFNTTYPSQNFANGQLFTVGRTIRIDSLTLRANNPVSGHIQIWSNTPENGGRVLQKIPFQITSKGVKDTMIYLGAVLSPASYFMNMEISSGNGILYRAIDGATYPYSFSNYLSITGTNFAGDPDRYYYFYRWVVSPLCASTISNPVIPAFTNTKKEQLPYLENFNTGLACDWEKSASNVNANWEHGNSTLFNSTNFALSSDSGIIASNDELCNCDKSNSQVKSPWFDLTKTSKAAELMFNMKYQYREINNSVVAIKINNHSNTKIKYDTLNASPNTFSNYSLSLKEFALEDSVQITIIHNDGGNNGSAIAINDFEIFEDCTNGIAYKVDLLLDQYASEISWTIRDASNYSLVAYSGSYNNVDPYDINTAKDNRMVCLEKNKNYIFKIEDVFGDGLDDGTHVGSYTLSSLCGDTLLFGSGALPFGGSILPELAWDSILFNTQPYKVDLRSDITIGLDDSITLDAGEAKKYQWSTGDTTRFLNLYGGDFLVGSHPIFVTVTTGISCESSDTVFIHVINYQTPRIIIDLVTDIKGSEIKWELRDVNTDSIIASKGPFNDVIPYNPQLATHRDTIYLGSGQLVKFKIFDSAGNGLFDGQNQGYINIANYCVPQIFRNEDINFPYQLAGQRFDSVVFNVDSFPIFNLGIDYAICEDAGLTLDAGTSANEYEWLINGTIVSTNRTFITTASGLNQGINEIIIRNHSGYCFISDTLMITKNNLPLAAINFSQQGATINLTATGPNTNTYFWDFGDGQTASGISTSHTYLSNGNYNLELKVTSPENCESSTSRGVTVTGIGIENYKQHNITIYPNPSTGNFYVSAESAILHIEVKDLQGRVLVEKYIEDQSKIYELNLNPLSTGMYFLKVNTDKGEFSKRIIIQ